MSSTRAAAAVGSSTAVWDHVVLRQLEESPERGLGNWPQYWEREGERERETATLTTAYSQRTHFDSMCLIVVRKH